MITIKQLKNLPVETTGGMRLGRVVDAEMHPESHQLMTFIVQPGRLTQPIARRSLRIARSQVVALSADRMVVEDMVTSGDVNQRSRGIVKNVPSPISARMA